MGFVRRFQRCEEFQSFTQAPPGGQSPGFKEDIMRVDYQNNAGYGVAKSANRRLQRIPPFGFVLRKLCFCDRDGARVWEFPLFGTFSKKVLSDPTCPPFGFVLRFLHWSSRCGVRVWDFPFFGTFSKKVHPRSHMFVLRFS